jgi:hypothetical protein
MTRTFSDIFNLAMSLIGAAVYFAVGWLWSASTWRRSFDLGWLVAAFLLSRYASARTDGANLRARDYLALCLPAIPGFFLEWFADSSLHDFRLHHQLEALVLFAVFSCGLLVLVITATALVQFGVGRDDLCSKDEGTWRSTIRIGAFVIATALILGTLMIVVKGTRDSEVRVEMLQRWLYVMSLIVYFHLTMKMMLPLILRRFRTAFDQREVRF